MSRDDSTAPVLGAFGLVAAILQFLATIELGLARAEPLARAAAEGAKYYLIGGLASLVGLVGVWTLRKRPMVAAGLLLGWQAAVLWPLRAKTSKLGLAYHGEFILHHFVTIVMAAVVIRIAWLFYRREDLPKSRKVVTALGTAGTLAALAAHLLSQPTFSEHAVLPKWSAVAPILLVATWAASIVVAWRHASTRGLQLAMPFLLLPWVVRLVAGGAPGLLGHTVPWQGRTWLMGSIVVSGIACFVFLRPRLARALWTLVMVSSFIATAMLYLVYRRGYGDLEDGLGSLAASVFGFVPPYPQYVPAYMGLPIMLGLFGIFTATYASLISPRTRARGIGLALLLCAGVGMTSPQLWLMVGAAGLLVVGSTLRASDVAGPAPPPRPVEPLLADVAERLGLPSPVVVPTKGGSIVALRGEVDDQPVDIRARPHDDGTWSIELTVGTAGRGKAEVELWPDPGDHGERPAHLLARSHRIRGPRKIVEQLDDGLLDPLVALPQSRVQLWPTGGRVDLGDDLRALAAPGIAELVDALRDRL